ncbi:MAG TPA: anion permease [Myxococcota bacterium]|nr:anion permease [Myxococcota bacterium]
MEWLVLAGTLLLAYVNGANDNMKGVATLYGSGALRYGPALALATVSTALGSLASIALAAGLVSAFSAKGLVPDALLTPEYLAAVALAASATVLLATRLGFPVSTTHALVGALAGAGALAAGPELRLGVLGNVFLLPLLAGPFLGLAFAFALDRAGTALGALAGASRETCVCVEGETPFAIADGDAASVAAPGLGLVIAHRSECAGARDARRFGIEVGRLLDWGHLASASSVGFARGLNDTPKLLGLLAGSSVVAPALGVSAIAAAMAVGGLVAARRVAETLAKKITPMSAAQGFSANAATALLVASASQLGLPVSTTHVSTGGIFGIGASGRGLRRRMAAEVVLAWIATLPTAALLGLCAMWALR